MFINVKNDHEIQLSAVGKTEMALLERLSKGVHIQAFDNSQAHASFLVIAPVLLPERSHEVSTFIGEP